MKVFILLLALSVLSSLAMGTSHDRPAFRKSMKIERIRRSYGSNLQHTGYNRIEIIKPTIPTTQTIAFDTTQSSGYGQVIRPAPVAMDIPVSSGYNQVVRPAPVAMDIPVSSGYNQVVRPAPVAMDIPVSSGYGTAQQVVQTVTAAPALDIPVSSGYGAAQQVVETVTAAPALDIPVSSGYGAAQQVVETVTAAPALDIPVVSTYSQQQPIQQTIALETRPVTGYNQVQSNIALDESAMLVLEPEYKQICLNKNAYGAQQTSSIFYLPHPTKKSFYIQCDEFGVAFLKQCPANTIFTQNLVCENINNLLPVEAKPQQQALDRNVVGTYGAAPSFSLDTVAPVQSTSNVEVIVEAPEFKNLCVSKNTYGAQVSSVFYVPHPTKQSFYIQCDEFGRAFLKECPIGTIFTSNLVCERINEVRTTVTETVVAPQQHLDRPVQETYGQVAQPTAVSLDVPTQVEVIVEAPEFKNLCANKNAYGVSSSVSVFYIPHPTKQSFYIQCDEFGRAFLKECPANTIFTSNLACENVNDLHTAERETVVKQALDQVSGTYGAAPSFSQDNVISTQSQSQVEVAVEAPEFKSLCSSRNTYGAQVSSVFYVAHPTDRTKYIQCNEFGSAFLKSCPLNTVFTANLVCEVL